MKTQRTQKKKTVRWLSTLVLFGVILNLSLPSGVLADGTPAGTTISNTATLSFEVNSTPQTAVPGTADFVVDRKLDLTVAEVATAYIPVTAAATERVMVFTVTNDGNAVQDFSLAAVQMATNGADPFGGLDSFDAASVAIYVETTGSSTGGYDSGEETLISTIDDLGIDATINVYVVSTMPNTLNQGDIAAVTLTATVLAADGSTYAGETGPSALEDVVFVDAAGDTDGVRDRAHSDTGAYQAEAPDFTVTKTSSIINDPFGNSGDFTNAFALPGTVVEYEIVANNGGNLDADAVTIVDTIPANTNYIVGTGVSSVPAADNLEWSNDNRASWTYAPAVGPDGISDPNVTDIRVTYNTVAQASGDHTVTFQVVIE